MSRPILPVPSIYGGGFGQQPEPPPPSHGSHEPKRQYTKRGAISKIACRSCRRRKTKCNSERPTCQNCAARSEPCNYDFDESDRSLTFLRDNVENLSEERNALESVLQVLQAEHEDNAMEMFRRLRSGHNIITLARQVSANRTTTASKRENSIGGSSSNLSRLDQYEQLLRAITVSSSVEQEEILRRLKLDFDPPSVLAAIRTRSLLQPLRATGTPSGIEHEYSNREQAFGLVKGTGPRILRSMDIEQAQGSSSASHEPWTTVTQDADLIEHLFCIYFSWQNCFFQNIPENLFREDFEKGGTRYCSRFLVNAICAAGCLLTRRVGARRTPEDPQLLGQAFCDAALQHLRESPGSSICTVAGLGILANFEASRGRLSGMWTYCGQSGRMALDLSLHLRDALATEETHESSRFEERGKMHAFWGCFITDQVTSFTLGRLPQIPINGVTTSMPVVDQELDEKPWIAYYDGSDPVVPGASSSTFREVVSLCIIVNSTLTLFFSPVREISGSLLLNEYKKYTKWKENLPSMITEIYQAPPHILCAHLLWHSAVLLLFRPFLKAKITDSRVLPQEICRRSANAISELFGRYKNLYNLQGIYSFQIQCLLTACTIHIIHIPSIASTGYFIEACNSLHDLASQNSWAKSSINILKDLVSKWGRILPVDAEAALYRDTERPNPSEAYNATLPDAQATQSSLSSISMPKRQRRHEANKPPLFAPTASQPAPLLRPVHSGSGDLDQEMEMFGQDKEFEGLNFASDDLFNPFMGSTMHSWDGNSR